MTTDHPASRTRPSLDTARAWLDAMEGAGGYRKRRSAIRLHYLALGWLQLLLIVAILAGLGGLLLRWAVDDSGLVRGLLGALSVTVAAYVTTDYVNVRWRNDRGSPFVTIVIPLAGLVGAVVAIACIAFEGPPWLAFLALAAFTLGIGPVIVHARDTRKEHYNPLVVTGLVISLVGVVLLFTTDLPGWARGIGLGLTLVGLSTYSSGLPDLYRSPEEPTRDVDPWLAVRIIPGVHGVATVGWFALGASLLILGAAVNVSVILVIGGWLVFAMLMALGTRPERFDLDHVSSVGSLVLGIALIGGAGYLVWVTGVARSWNVLFFLALVLSLFGAFIVWEGELIFISVLLGFALVWGLFSFTVDDVAGESSAGLEPAGVVAFGDSFISGEGAAEFFDGTDQKGDERNECRRAPTAYPYLLSLDTDGVPRTAGDDEPLPEVEGLTVGRIEYIACSGAKINQVVHPAGEPESAKTLDQLDCPAEERQLNAQYPCGPEGVYGDLVQIDNLPDSPDDLRSTQLVLLSIGGNDARFGEIISACLLPGSCAERREIWLDNVATLGPRLEHAYRTIRAAFNGEPVETADDDGDSDDAGRGDGAQDADEASDGVDASGDDEPFDQDAEIPIVVMPYPLVVTEDSCSSSPLNDAEHEFIHEFTTVLNQQIEAAARRAGVHYFEGAMFAFVGHRVCEVGSADRAINLIKLQPTDGDFLERINPSGWTHNSMHPNEIGHRLTAEALATWLSAEDVLARGNPVPEPLASRAVLDVRAARPFAVEPETVRNLLDDQLMNATCDFGAVSTFATRIDVFDEQAEDGSLEPFSVPIVGADSEAEICYTDSEGNWRARSPVTVADTTVTAPTDDVSAVATFEGGQVFITGGRPNDDCVENFRGRENFGVESVCDYQWVLFSRPIDDGAGEDDGASRTWEFRAINYCSVDPDCDDTFAEWSRTQLNSALSQVALPLALIVLGGWLIAFGLRVNRIRNRLETVLFSGTSTGSF